jgi:hypothetical protein
MHGACCVILLHPPRPDVVQLQALHAPWVTHIALCCRLLERLPAEAGTAAEKWLRDNGVNVLLGDRVDNLPEVRYLVHLTPPFTPAGLDSRALLLATAACREQWLLL